MKVAALVAAAAVCAAAIAIILVAFTTGSTNAPSGPVVLATRAATPPAPTATPLPRTWQSGLRIASTGVPELISCLDANHDGRLSAADDAHFAGLDIALASGESCVAPQKHADFFVGTASDPARFSCAAPKPPLLIVAVASAGSDLLQPGEGESMGEIDIVNALQANARAAGISTLPIFAASAVFGAKQPQTSMEHWLAHDIALRLLAMPCLRAALIGHSHGAVTVTSVTAALDSTFGSRMFGALIDRTTVLYDRNATEMPVRTPLLDIFQTNEGWHGEPIDQPNITNVDASREEAPIAPSDGGGGPALVSHKTLDDAPAVQQRIVSAVLAWAEGR